MQHNLNILHDYCMKWKLTVNKDKTKILIFRKGGRIPDNLHFYYGNSEIEIVSQYCYLGVVMTTCGSWIECQKTLAGQAQKAIYKLKSYLFKYTNLSVEHVLELFDKLVKPILLYSCEIWGFTQACVIERIHTMFCKSVLCI